MTEAKEPFKVSKARGKSLWLVGERNGVGYESLGVPLIVSGHKPAEALLAYLEMVGDDAAVGKVLAVYPLRSGTVAPVMLQVVVESVVSIREA